MISKKAHLREVYVWQLPVRIFHWVNAFAITILCITGYIIGDPRMGTADTFHSRIYFYNQLFGTHLLVLRRKYIFQVA